MKVPLIFSTEDESCSDHEASGSDSGEEEMFSASSPSTMLASDVRNGRRVCMDKREYSARHPWAAESKNGKICAIVCHVDMVSVLVKVEPWV